MHLWPDLWSLRMRERDRQGQTETEGEQKYLSVIFLMEQVTLMAFLSLEFKMDLSCRSRDLSSLWHRRSQTRVGN